jgi:hypothetical protein
MPFAAHHARKVKPTHGKQYYGVMPLLSAAHPSLEDAEGLDNDH